MQSYEFKAVNSFLYKFNLLKRNFFTAAFQNSACFSG